MTGFKALPGQVGSLGYLALPVLKPLPVCALSRMPKDSKIGLWKILIIAHTDFHKKIAKATKTDSKQAATEETEIQS